VREMKEVLDTFHLRTPPFFPEIGPDGEPVDKNLVARALNPALDARLLHYYFDLYDWSESPMIGGISQVKAFDRFPEDIDLNQDGTMLVLLSGTSQTGRDSLANLILFAIEKKLDKKPFMVLAELDDLSREQNIKDLARLFISSLEESPSFSQEYIRSLEAIYESEIKEVSVGSQTLFPVLFKRLSSKVKSRLKMPIVFMVKGERQTFDFWRCLYNSTRSLADFIIVQTSQVADASTCRARLSNEGKNVAHIHAPLLDIYMAEQYIRARLAAERPTGVTIPPTDGLIPFSRAALDVLYEPGADSNGRTPKWSIGWLRRTLLRAMEDHFDELTEVMVKNNVTTLSALPPASLLIGRERVLKTRRSLNLNRGAR
jgi:hypothetical protein